MLRWTIRYEDLNICRDTSWWTASLSIRWRETGGGAHEAHMHAAIALAHETHMRAAIALAQSSVTKGNHPFGAVLVLDGEIVCEAENTVHSDHDPTRHAESNLCSIANTQLSVAQRKQATLYTSTEPCPMCSGAIYWSSIGKVVFACPAIVLGEISGEELAVPCRTILSSGILHSVEVVGPVLEEAAASMHREFWPTYTGGGAAPACDDAK